jgi:predicted cupin superfamily sugar epimerase
MHLEAEKLIVALKLAPHPEGGFYRETYRSPHVVEAHGGTRAAHTEIYFLLASGEFSAFHRVASDEVWHHDDGDPLDLHLIDEAGRYTHVTLGHRYGEGERPQHVVPAGVWQAAAPRGDLFALCGCTVAPGFDFADFAMPPRADLVARFPAHAEIVTRLTREA